MRAAARSLGHTGPPLRRAAVTGGPFPRRSAPSVASPRMNAALHTGRMRWRGWPLRGRWWSTSCPASEISAAPRRGRRHARRAADRARSGCARRCAPRSGRALWLEGVAGTPAEALKLVEDGQIPLVDQPRRGRRRADGRRREPEHAGVGGARRGDRQGRLVPAERGLGRGAALRRRRPGGAGAPEVDARRARAGAARRRCARGPLDLLRPARALARARRRGAPPHRGGHGADARGARHRAPRGARLHRRQRPVLPQPGDGLLQARAGLRRGRAGLAGPHRDRPQRRRGRHPRLRAPATSGSSARPRCPTRRSCSTATRRPT